MRSTQMSRAVGMFLGFLLLAPWAITAVTVTDPTTTPVETWTVGNGQTVTFTNGSGWSTHKVTIYDTAVPTNEFFSVTHVMSSNPQSENLTVPDTGASHGTTVPSTVKAEIFNAMGTSMGSGTAPVDIYKP